MIDLDTAQPLTVTRDKGGASAALAIPIVNDRQSAHLRLTGTLKGAGYALVGGEMVFARTLKGLRNTILLPKGWEVSGVSQSGVVGTERTSGRAFVSLINLNAENAYTVTIRAKKSGE